MGELNEGQEVVEQDVVEVDAGVQTEQDAPQSMEDALWADDAGDEGDAEPSDEGGDEPKDEKPAAEPEDEYAEPDGLSDKASTRFQKLANENKQYKSFGSVDELQGMQADAQTLNVFRERINDCGMQPAELESVFDYTKAVKSGDWPRVERYLHEQIYQFQILTGKRMNVDPLQAYPDIKQEVESMSLTEERALEVARNRWINDIQTQQNQQAQAQQRAQMQQSQQFEHTRASALDEVEAMAQHWSQTDVLWAERQPLLRQFIETNLSSQPPHTWAAGIQAFYSALSMQQPARSRSPSALRPNAMGSQSAGKEASSMADALWG